MDAASPISLDEGAGELLWYDGGLITFKATGRETNGDLLLFEAWMPEGKATPLHVHEGSDESFFVIDGEIRTHIDGVDGTVATGAVVVIPRGTPHAFAVKSPTVRLLVIFTPADAVSEAFFRAAGSPAGTATLPEGSPDVERLMAAAQKTGLQVLGPPPFADAMNA